MSCNPILSSGRWVRGAGLVWLCLAVGHVSPLNAEILGWVCTGHPPEHHAAFSSEDRADLAETRGCSMWKPMSLGFANVRRYSGRNSIMGLLAMEGVCKELDLSEEQFDRVTATSRRLMAERREQFAGIRESGTEKVRKEKMSELNHWYGEAVRTGLRKELSREQLGRLVQIRIQALGPAHVLNLPWSADLVQLTDEQKKKLDELQTSTQRRLRTAMDGIRDLDGDERRAKMDELRRQLTGFRQAADEEALGLLTTEQKEVFGKITGEKISLSAPAR